MNELGYNTTDINGPVQTGTAVLQAFIDSRGRRSSIANCYLDPNPFPQNLDILTGAQDILSTDPFVYPVINSRFLSDPQDFEDMVDITKWALYVFERSSIAPYVRPHKPIPGCKFCAGQRFAHKCDAYIRCLIRQVTYTGYHLVGSCRMGAAHRRDTVVDHRLRVKGVDGLRVCDASVMPTVTNGNTNASVIMIGEKCADLVKEDNNSVSA
jgi:choline dehydrogenase